MSDADHQEVVLNDETNLITTRQGNYRAKVGAQGYIGAEHQVHHVLPCGSSNKSKEYYLEKVQKDDPEIDLGLAKKLLEQTTHWDVNETPNLIGLPTRVVYALKFGTEFGIPLPSPIPINPAVSCNLPIHLWNHTGYSKAAKLLLDDVWAEAKLKIEKHKDGKTTLSATDIKDAIQGVSDDLRDGITTTTRKRTKEAWRSGNNREIFQIYPFPVG